MSPIVLLPMPKTQFRKHRVFDEDGTLGPAEPVTDVVYSTNPESSLMHALNDLDAGYFLLVQ